MFTLFLIIIIISILILVHEWGHFFAARVLGVKVEEFGIGFSGKEFGLRFPPKLLKIFSKGVLYSINPLPFGGFVKIYGEQGEGEKDPASFSSRPAWQRFIILAAGVFMNLVLAWIFFSGGTMIGIPNISDDKDSRIPVSLIAVTPGSPAEHAGLRFGDQVLELRSSDISLRVEYEDDIRKFVDAYRGEKIMLIIKRGNDIKEISATPRVNPPEGEGPLGIGMGRLTLVRAPWYLAPVEGGKILGRSISATLNGFVMLAKELIAKGPRNLPVSGPIGIFSYAQDTKALGMAYFLQFMGILSVNLAILNFLPIPALDGGRALFLLIEKIKGRRVEPHFENVIHTVGFVLLILLMVAVTYKDVVKIL
ncbi:MAG: hypothetical protein G01um101433_239 [Parcubacteria group bacterium Gr01-1014_33]|nr:MAG: hypothetical protein G01um101433_239 [Parcubacteria group bacterium Gr01-1014_33]